MMEKILSQVYYDQSSPVSYSGKLAVYKAAKALYPKTTRRKVATWLSKQFTCTMRKSVRYHFKTNRVFAEGIDYQGQADLADMGSVQKYNYGFRYLLTCIDVFSKYAWAISLRNKTSTNLVSAFKTILSSNRKPTFLQTDDGTEFKNPVFQQFLKDNGIKFFTTRSEEKANIVERFNPTLKTKTWKHFTAKNIHTVLMYYPN